MKILFSLVLSYYFIPSLLSQQPSGFSIYKPYKEVLINYPELANLKIKTKFKTRSATAQVQPTITSIFRRASKRTYIITFNDNLKKGGVIWKYTEEAQKGVICHEMGHITYFLKTNSLKIIVDGIKYIFSKKFHREYEQATDQRCIDHGMGENLWLRCTEKLNNPSFTTKYKKQFKKYYYSCEEIENQLEKK